MMEKRGKESISRPTSRDGEKTRDGGEMNYIGTLDPCESVFYVPRK